jgi:hypothetical protein
MHDHVSPPLPESSAVRVFEELRCEVSLLRRAIEGLTAERRDQPDYGPTLEELVTSTEQIRVWARRVNELPALKLTPQSIGDEIEAAASRFRDLDQRKLQDEHSRLTEATREVKAISLAARTAREQERREKIVGGLSFLCGLMLVPLLSMFEMLFR